MPLEVLHSRTGTASGSALEVHVASLVTGRLARPGPHWQAEPLGITGIDYEPAPFLWPVVLLQVSIGPHWQRRLLYSA